MFKTMKYWNVQMTLLIIIIYGQDSNATPHCDAQDYFFKMKYDLICSGIGSLPSQELESYFNDKNDRQPFMIHIFNSSLKRIPTNFFYRFEQLQEIYLDHCEIDTLETNCFLGLQQLHKLFLNNNNISALNSDSLSSLSDAFIVNLSENALVTIHKDTFKDLTNLEELYLSGNKLEILPDELFSFTRKIKHIDLSRNNLKMLNSKTFFDLKELLTLNLNNNHLQELQPDLFKDLSKLERLSISHNELKRISNGPLSGLEHLKYFDISNNELVTLDYEYNFSIRIMDHNISIEKLPNSTESCCNKSGEDVVLMMGSLQQLHNLEELNLEKNNISKIGSEFLRGLTTLKHLFLSNNRLHEIHTSAFENLPSLEILDLNNNKLETINVATFKKLWKLKSLQLGNNQLKSVPVSLFRDVEQLNDLSMSNNLLTYIPTGLLSPLQQLKDFNISNNHFTELNAVWFHALHSLVLMDVSNNNIGFLDAEILTNVLPNLNKIALNGNCWTCNTLLNIIQVFQIRNIDIIDGRNINTENIYGIKCTNTTSLRTNNESNSNDATYTINMDTGIKEILEGILNNSKITNKLLDAAVQQFTKGHPLDTYGVQSSHFMGEVPSSFEQHSIEQSPSEHLQVMELTSNSEDGKTYGLIFLTLAVLLLIIMYLYKHFQSKRHNFFIDGIVKYFNNQQQNRSNIDLMSKNEIEIVNS